MKKHVHDALIREWLDNGLPLVQYKRPGYRDWQDSESNTPAWNENTMYRLVYPPKPKKQIKILCYFNGSNLFWTDRNDMEVHGNKRVPAEDKLIEVEQ